MINQKVKVALASMVVASSLASTPAFSLDPMIGQINMVGFNFAPRNWALCDGQLLSISQNTALFSLLGTTYGGDGRITFGLPDMRGRTAVHAGTGPGLSTVRLGEKGGAQSMTLSTNNLPSHNHTASVAIDAVSTEANQEDPSGNSHALLEREDQYSDSVPDVTMAATAITTDNTGGGQSFNLRSPYIGINHVIALFGIFPSRN